MTTAERALSRAMSKAERAVRVIPIAVLSRGMTLIERSETGKRKETPVKRVSLSPEGCRHSVHVNDNACYPRQSYVTVLAE